jgi:hypothetical protein
MNVVREIEHLRRVACLVSRLTREIVKLYLISQLIQPKQSAIAADLRVACQIDGFQVGQRARSIRVIV